MELQRQLGEKEQIIASTSKKLALTKNLLRVKAQSCKRLQRNRQQLQSTLSSLKRKSQTTNTSTKVPVGSEILNELMKRQNLSKVAQYSDSLRQFAYSLRYYSPRAYDFARQEIPFLPSTSSLHNWTTHIQTPPGFLETSLSYIREKTAETTDALYFALTIDEMHIRKQIIHRGDGFIGYVDYGSLASLEGNGKVATTALFVMATQINGTKKIPIGYALTNGLKGETLAEIIKNSLFMMSNVNAHVLSITFDGLPCNLKAVQLLGANLDVKTENLRPFIVNPATSENVYIILDPSHMLKLIRNTFKDYSVIIDPNGNKICWNHIVMLYRLQPESGLKAANKLTSRHVNFQNQKMKTKLCVQVLSNSVAVALGVCRELKIEGFEETKATEEFLSLFDKLFDLLNSKTMGKNYKGPLRLSNINERMDFFSLCKSYLMGLRRMDGMHLLDSPRGTGIKGLLITIRSIELICRDIFLDDNHVLKYLPTFKLGHDMLECFFGLIRSRGGYNNNPNVVQLEGALKATLCMKTQSIKTGNCIEQEEMTSTVSALSRLQTIVDDTSESVFHEDQEIEPINFEDLSLFVSNIVLYVAGWVARKLCSSLSCTKCIVMLHMKPEDMPKLIADCTLLHSRDLGGLFHPSYEAVTVCKITEHFIRQFESNGLHQIAKKKILSCVRNECTKTGLELKCEEGSDHSSIIIHDIALNYISVRFHYLAKQSSLELNPTTNRSTCTKNYIFSGN